MYSHVDHYYSIRVCIHKYPRFVWTLSNLNEFDRLSIILKTNLQMKFIGQSNKRYSGQNCPEMNKIIRKVET